MIKNSLFIDTPHLNNGRVLIDTIYLPGEGHYIPYNKTYKNQKGELKHGLAYVLYDGLLEGTPGASGSDLKKRMYKIRFKFLKPKKHKRFDVIITQPNKAKGLEKIYLEYFFGRLKNRNSWILPLTNSQKSKHSILCNWIERIYKVSNQSITLVRINKTLQTSIDNINQKSNNGNDPKYLTGFTAFQDLLQKVDKLPDTVDLKKSFEEFEH